MKSRYIRLLRPIAWITFLLPFSVGLGLGLTSKGNPFHILFAFIAFISWMSFSFLVNAIADKEVDRFHDGRSKDMNLSFQPLVTGEVSEKEALYLSVIFLFTSLLFAWLVNPFFLLLIFIVDIFGYVYSMPPFRFKTKPIVDILCNALSAGVVYIAGLSIGGANMDLIMILGVFIMASTFYIPTVVTDYSFDKKAGLNTSAVFFGPKKILKVMYLLTAIILLIGIIVLLISNLELKVLALLIIFYSFVFTIASNYKLKGGRLYLHANWILIPFALISVVFVLYGIIKLLGIFLPLGS